MYNEYFYKHIFINRIIIETGNKNIKMGKSVRIEQYILTRIYLNNIYNLPHLYTSKIQTPNDSLRNCIIP